MLHLYGIILTIQCCLFKLSRESNILSLDSFFIEKEVAWSESQDRVPDHPDCGAHA